MREKICLTGFGFMSPLGNSLDELFSNLLENKTAVREFPDWRRYNGFRSFLGAPVGEVSTQSLSRNKRRTMSRMSEMATIATLDALKMAGIQDLQDDRTLICMGSTSGSPVILEQYFRNFVEKGGPEGQLSTTFFKVMNHTVAANVASAIDYRGPLMAPSSACSSSSQAVSIGWELLQSGLYDRVIAGGADELCHTSAAVFDGVLAASRGFNDQPSASPRPFDVRRDGLVVAEGASVVILERESSAQKREAKILGEIAGAAYLADGAHMTQPQTGSMIHTMRSALRRAHLSESEVDHVSAHATGTVLGDQMEAEAIGEIFGKSVSVSSLKGHLGHTLAACGGLEIISALGMIQNKKAIPTRNLEELDPKCAQIWAIQEVLSPKRLKTVMINNFAFGGMSNSVVLRSSV